MTMKFRQQVKVYFKRLIRNNESPQRLALSLALGVFVGITPLWGFHALIAISLAFIFRLNKVATLLGTLINNHFTAVPFTLASLYVGNLILGRSMETFEFPENHSLFDIDFWKEFIIPRAGEFALPLGLGSLVVGAVSGAIIYFVFFRIIIKFRKKRELTRQKRT